jgi:hypothetical protein
MRHVVFFLALTAAAQSGVPPRPASNDYPAHSDRSGAAIVPPLQVSKVFSNAIARDYIVVEFAFYPAGGQDIDLQSLDFALNDGADSRAYPATSNEAAWHGVKPPSSSQGPHILAEAGVIVGSHGTSAVYGGVGVDNRPAPPPPAPADDPYAIEARLRNMALPGGRADRPVAGYLYFPKASSKRPKGNAYGLEYSLNGERKQLVLPLK